MLIRERKPDGSLGTPVPTPAEIDKQTQVSPEIADAYMAIAMQQETIATLQTQIATLRDEVATLKGGGQ